MKEGYEHPKEGDVIEADWLFINATNGKRKTEPVLKCNVGRCVSKCEYESAVWLKPIKPEFPLEIPGWKHDRTFDGWCVTPNNENCIALLTGNCIALLTGNKTYIYLKIPKVCTECGRELE